MSNENIRKGDWVECINPLKKPSHYFFLKPNAEYFERQRICCLCHYAQLSNEHYRQPQLSIENYFHTQKSNESKPEKESL